MTKNGNFCPTAACTEARKQATQAIANHTNASHA
jgi:hypothetical protein